MRVGFMDAAHEIVNDFRMTIIYKYLVLELDGEEFISIDDTDRKRVKFYCSDEGEEICSISIASEFKLVIINCNGLFATVSCTDISGKQNKMTVPVTSLRLYLVDENEEEE